MNQDTDRVFQLLKNFPLLADIPEAELTWLSPKLKEVQIAAGQILAQQGGPADSFHILLEGEFQLRYESSQDTRMMPSVAGEIVGKLPYSRLTHWPGTFRAITNGRALSGSTDLFPEMTRETPAIVQRLVTIMSDRIRTTTKEDQQRDKLAALGKLSAGLAHELNNPAASAKRAALGLSEAQEALRKAISRLDCRELTADERKAISSFERQAIQHAQAPVLLDSITRSEQEEVITFWLKQHGVKDGWKFAPALVDAALDVAWLETFREKVKEAFEEALARIVAQVLTKHLTREIESSTGRISELVRAIKEYSYMDQAPIQEVDLHQGLDNTLVMLRYKLRQGIEVERDFDSHLPHLCAYGSELNQVWTNLLDNAVDAMKNGGKLTIRTSRDENCAQIEIIDTGTGIPEEIQHRIFDPFFTTKTLGEGTGLGLDTVWRIIHKYHGSIRVESEPGNTHFYIRLPLKQIS